MKDLVEGGEANLLKFFKSFLEKQLKRENNVLKILQHSIKVNQAYFTRSLHTYL